MGRISFENFRVTSTMSSIPSVFWIGLLPINAVRYAMNLLHSPLFNHLHHQHRFSIIHRTSINHPNNPSLHHIYHHPIFAVLDRLDHFQLLHWRNMIIHPNGYGSAEFPNYLHRIDLLSLINLIYQMLHHKPNLPRIEIAKARRKRIVNLCRIQTEKEGEAREHILILFMTVFVWTS